MGLCLQELIMMNINEILNRNVIIDGHDSRFKIDIDLEFNEGMKDEDRNIIPLNEDKHLMYLFYNIYQRKMVLANIIDRIVDKVNIFLDDSGLPRYYHGTNNIVLTKPNIYKSPHLFFSVMFHELTHWMIHNKESVIDKQITLLSDEEEVVAELVSMCIMEELGYLKKIKQYNLDYIDYYLELIRDNKDIDPKLSIEKMKSLTERLIDQFNLLFYKEC